MRIVITGSRRATELARLITNFGGIPCIVPTVGIEISQEVSTDIEIFVNKILEEKMDYVIFMTAVGVYLIMSTAERLGLKDRLVEALNQVIIICRSSKSKYALASHRINTNIVPHENTANGIAESLKNYLINSKKVGIVWHGSTSAVLRDLLQKCGAQVFECSVYGYSPDLKKSGAEFLKTMGFNYKTPEEEKIVEVLQEITKGAIDAITFTSPPAVNQLFKIAERYNEKESLQVSLNGKIIVVAVGPSTYKALAENGVKVDVMPHIYKMGPMVKALRDYINQI
jgi:uroporphyrinogen-III synthase